MPDSTAAWDQFIFWARKVFELDYFEGMERPYKLEIAKRLDQAKSAFFEEQDDWFQLLKRAFTTGNNITGWQQHATFLDWVSDNPESGKQALSAIWDQSISAKDRFDQFQDILPKSSKVTSVNLASFLHMVNDASQFPPYKPSKVRDAYRLTETAYRNEGSFGSTYQTFLDFLDEFIRQALARDLAIEDRLDAQGLMWSITFHEPHDPWSEEDKRAFRSYRETGLGKSTPTVEPMPSEHTREAILEALTTFDSTLRQSDEWANWEDRGNHKYAIVHDGKLYPVKQIVSMATGQSVSEFSGGEEANAYVVERGFVVEPIDRNYGVPMVWWVNQGDNFTVERQGEYIWAPMTGARGNSLAHWTALTQVNEGDIILHYSKTALRAASVVSAGSVESPQPDGYTEGQQRNDGWLVRTTYHDLAAPLSLGEIPTEWRVSGPGSPFNVTGGVNQGYLYNAPNFLLQRLIRKFPDIWPQEVLDRASILPNLTIDLAKYVEPPFDEIVEHLAGIQFRISDRTLRRYHVALKTRGFVILAGPSGTGKTWLTKAYADAVGAEHCIVSVAPNWTANEDLMGFFNPVSQVFHYSEFTRFLQRASDAYHEAREAGVEARPYHLVLDEMNLARVEYYFASFLSAMETRARHTTTTMQIGPDIVLELTPNLKVIGTVNIDETTHGFADKVYDRAQLLALDVTLGEIEHHVAGRPHGDDVIEIWKIVSRYKPFAFRVLDEIAAYVQESGRIDVSWEEALDEQILSKILPRLNGHDVVVGTVLQELTEYLHGRFPLSHSRAQRMSHDHTVHGFTSYFG